MHLKFESVKLEFELSGFDPKTIE